MLVLLNDAPHNVNSFSLALSEDSTSVDRFLEQMDVGPVQTPSRSVSRELSLPLAMGSSHSTPQLEPVVPLAIPGSSHSTPKPEPIGCKQQIGIQGSSGYGPIDWLLSKPVCWAK